ncbi:MAG: 2-C-methyl-D-erythritol 4-phosphate cytidylyltransferase [Actinobacteria bacterium]|nr:2-C-methyl-D-erythritol 4-phosphate cytidylyltransferase [Actinomycetota bacterium]
MVFGVITAAGAGLRLQGETTKLEVEILGKPLVLYALEAFQRASCVESLILVVPPERLDAWPVSRLLDAGIGKAVAVAAGGPTRQESVYLALEEIPDDSGTVVVHDGARPLVTPDMIEAACSAARGEEAVITAVPLTDTVKQVEGGRVIHTPDREKLVAVQTPQAFSLQLLREAHRQARQEGFQGTDDASLVERLGRTVVVIEGSRENIKITHPGDLVVVKAILSERIGR